MMTASTSSLIQLSLTMFGAVEPSVHLTLTHACWPTAGDIETQRQHSTICISTLAPMTGYTHEQMQMIEDMMFKSFNCMKRTLSAMPCCSFPSLRAKRPKEGVPFLSFYMFAVRVVSCKNRLLALHATRGY